VRKRGKDDLRVSERRVLSCHIGDLGTADSRPLAALFLRSREHQFERRVPGDQPAQLPTSVAAGSEDSYRNFMHN
jgi:hypothetical protein